MAIQLAVTEYGAGEPVAILHGLLGAGRNWAGIARRLGEQRRVLAFDLRNHGSSPWAATMHYAEMAGDVRASMGARGHCRYALIGHSLGGKVAMTAALAAPGEIERLVVVDIAPVAYPTIHPGYVRAMRALDPATITRRSEADAALAAAVPDPAERGFLLQNLVIGANARWQPNLTAIEGALPCLSGFPAFPPGCVFRGPALFVAGERSEYLGAERQSAARRLFPNARFVAIAGAGHWVHAEQPDAFIDAVAEFLAG